MPRALLFTLSHQPVDIIDRRDGVSVPLYTYDVMRIEDRPDVVAVVPIAERVPAHRLRAVDRTVFAGTLLDDHVRGVYGSHYEVLYALDPHTERLLTTHIREELDAMTDRWAAANNAKAFAEQEVSRLNQRLADFWSMPWYRRVWAVLTKRTEP